MKRYMVVDKVGTGAEGDPFRPAYSGSFVVVGEHKNKYMIKVNVPDTAVADTDTFVDLVDVEGQYKFKDRKAFKGKAFATLLKDYGHTDENVVINGYDVGE